MKHAGPALWIGLVLLLTTAAVYSRVHDHEFLNYDDPDYVTENAHVRQGLTADGLAWALESQTAANWFPLTWLSHMLDCQLFGVRSGPQHLVSVLFHSANTVLLFLLLLRITGAQWRSAFVAFVFGLHPLHIESVAWIAERKDVLSAFFWFATLWAYVLYTERRSAARYASVLLLFCCGLMSKPMIVTLPLVLSLLDFWPLKRLRARRAFLEKLPLWALSIVVSAVTYIVQQRGGAVVASDQVPISLRIANALLSYLLYIAKMFWPAHLAVFYPYPASIPLSQQLAAVVVLCLITVLVVYKRREKPYLFVGWFWYLVTLLPVIGLVQVGVQARADRYTYIPIIGIAILLAWSAADVVGLRPRLRPALVVASSLVCFAMAAVTFQDLAYWRDSAALFRNAIDVTAGNYVAYNNLGAALRRQGNLKQAITNFRAALRIKPGYSDAQNNLGEALLASGRSNEALPYLAAAVRARSSTPEAHVNLGTLLNKQGRTAEAAAEYRAALQHDPANAEAHCGLGVILMDQNRNYEALSELTEAVRLKPGYTDAHYNLGRLLGITGRTNEAITEFSTVIQQRPGDAQAHFNLGTAYASLDRIDDAIAEFRAATSLQPDYANAHFNLATALARAERYPEAIAEFSATLRIAPDFPNARSSLDYCRQLQRNK